MTQTLFFSPARHVLKRYSVPAAGEIIANRFRLVRELGRGSMGSVWLAQHLTLEVPCAVKFIVSEATNDENYRARFHVEARTIAQLKCPNVVRVIDHDIGGDHPPYIAMEYLEGDDLWMRLQRVGRLSPGETYVVASQIARGLYRAHGAGIVHRDLKPENVFLAREGDETIVKLLDFGIAKWTVSPFDEGDGLIGTPEYMSPEQARGALEVDYRADLWGLAVITYQCLTGKLPFAGETVAATLAQVTAGSIPVPSQVAPDLPAEFDVWWARAAARNIDDRFQGATELAEALGRALGFSNARAEEATAPQTDAAMTYAPHPRLPSPLELSPLESSTTLSYRPRFLPKRRGRIAAPAAGLVAALVALLAGAGHDQASIARANLARRVQAIESPAPSRAAPSRVEVAEPAAAPSAPAAHDLSHRPARVTRPVRAARPLPVISWPPPSLRPSIDPSPRIEPTHAEGVTVPEIDLTPPKADPRPKKEEDAVDFGI